MLTKWFKPILIIAAILVVFTTFNYANSCGNPDVKAAFRALTPKQRAQVWVSHLAYSYRTENLNREQQKFIGKAADLLTEERYTFAEGSDKGEIAALVPQMKKLFNRDQIERIFLELTIFEANGYKLVPVMYKRLSIPGLDMGACTCNRDTIGVCTECRWWLQPGGSLCTPMEFGCGPFGYFQCNGWGCGGGVLCEQQLCPPEA